MSKKTVKTVKDEQQLYEIIEAMKEKALTAAAGPLPDSAVTHWMQYGGIAGVSHHPFCRTNFQWAQAEVKEHNEANPNSPWYIAHSNRNSQYICIRRYAGRE